jgi:hypothetical protein
MPHPIHQNITINKPIIVNFNNTSGVKKKKARSRKNSKKNINVLRMTKVTNEQIMARLQSILNSVGNI